MKILLILVCVGLQAACFASEAKQEIPLLPSDAFGSLPDVSSLSLSPGGKKILARILVDTAEVKGTALQVTNLETMKKKIVLFADNIKYDINWTRWKNDSTLLVGIIFPHSRDRNYGPQAKTRETDLLVIHLEDERINNIFSSIFLANNEVKPAGRDNLIDILPDDDDHVLMSLIRCREMRDKCYSPSVYKVNIHNQKVDLIMPAEDYVAGWMTDRQHRVRLSINYRDDETYILVQDIDSEKWKELWRFRYYSKDYVEPMGFTLDPNILYIKAYLNSYLAVFKVDLRDPDLKRKLVYANEKYDVDGSLIYSKSSNDVLGISASYGDGVIYFDSRFKGLRDQIKKALPSTENYIYSVSVDEKRYLVFAYSDTVSGIYLYGDRENGSLKTMAYRYKKLLPEYMALTQRWNYKARDNKVIEGFLTGPRNTEQKNLPAIIFPHGGPVAYDDMSFDYWVQFFANRGYAVLRINYRGSAGRGFAFRNEGLKTREKAMQDIEDGTRELIKAGIADPNRVCIVGASYGGYAALYGATKTPDLYECAVSFAGISNIEDTYKLNEKEELVKVRKSAKRLSPINYVKNVKIPILLIHGNQDRQVEVKQSVEMHKALKKAKKDVTFVELKHEDHYLTDNENRRTTFKVMDKFLKKHLPVMR